MMNMAPEGNDSDHGRSELVGLSDDQVADLRGTLRHLIDHMAQRIEYAESRRSTLTLIAAALVAAGVALLSVVLTQGENLAVSIPLGTLCASGIGVGLMMWFVYGQQTNFPYPFVGQSRTWKWFYHYALREDEFTAPWHGVSSTQLQRAGREAYRRQWLEFKNKQISGLSDLRTDTMQDLEQVYLLHVNERYKNLFLTQLRRVLNRGMVVAALITLAALGVGLGLEIGRAGGDSVGQRGSGVHDDETFVVESSWRPTSAARITGTMAEEIELLVNLRVTNRSSARVSLGTITARDRWGMVLPVSVGLMNPTALDVAGHSSLGAVALVWIPKDLSHDLDHFEVGQ